MHRSMSDYYLVGAREGRIARARGTPRADNPYARAPEGPFDSESEIGRPHFKMAWWSGWDQAEFDLRSGSRLGRARNAGASGET
jgi:hypothetical protein